MTKTESGGAKDWIDRHLWAMLAAGMALYGGYLTSQTTANAEIDALQQDIADLQRSFDEMHPRQR